jgi:hypothetical protein
MTFENSSRNWAWLNGCGLHWLMRFHVQSRVSTFWPITWYVAQIVRRQSLILIFTSVDKSCNTWSIHNYIICSFHLESPFKCMGFIFVSVFSPFWRDGLSKFTCCFNSSTLPLSPLPTEWLLLTVLGCVCRNCEGFFVFVAERTKKLNHHICMNVTCSRYDIAE